MKVTYCPYCNNHTLVDDRDWGLLIQCEGPRCEKFFPTAHLVQPSQQPTSTNPEPPVVKLPAATPRFNTGAVQQPRWFTPPKPHLTGPHLCQVCKEEIREAFGKRRDTILHRRLAQAENCRTDIYAALYQCPGCLTSLETPAADWGKEVVCPVERCKRQFLAPFDNLIHRTDGDHLEGASFSFHCTACNGDLRCDTLRGGQPTTGLPVVCSWCSQIITVPASGQFVPPGV